MKAYYFLCANVWCRLAKEILGFFSLILLILQIGLIFFEIEISEPSAAWLSIASGSLLVAAAANNDRSLKNWMLWFSGFFFLLYQFGAMLGMTFLNPVDSYIDYPSTFGEGAGENSRVLSYILSGISASLLSLLVTIYPPNRKISIPVRSPALEKFSFSILLFVAPFVYVHYLWMFKTFGGGNYMMAYSSDAKDLESIVPFYSIFTNVFNLGFLLWFAAVPLEKNFKFGAVLFLLASFLSSMYGGRINFVVPVAFLVWYRAIAYNKSLSRKSIVVVLCVILAFVFVMESIRHDAGVEFSGMLTFLVGSISKAQYILSQYVEHKDLVDRTGSVYWAAPLIFPYDYLVHGGAAVAQGEASAGIRGDLNHVMSSTLNYSAYVSGAGMGSSLVAEAYQYGLLVMLLILSVFYFSYRSVFSFLRFRIVFLVAPLLFMHLIFSGRDSLFPNSWGLLKVAAIYIVAVYFLPILRSSRQ